MRQACQELIRSRSTVVATVTSPAKVKRHNRCKPDEPGWLSSVRTSAASHLSSACSCLITPAVETITVSETGSAVAQASEVGSLLDDDFWFGRILCTNYLKATVDVTAQGTQTVSVTLTDLASTVEVDTISSTTLVPVTATTSVTLTVVLTADATAYETTTITSTQTIERTALTVTVVTQTVGPSQRGSKRGSGSSFELSAS